MRGDLRRLGEVLEAHERRQWVVLLPVAAVSVVLEAVGAVQ
jgi:hypothetical protein